MPSHLFDLADDLRFADQVVVFTGKLSSLGRREARALVARLGGSTADDLTAQTTLLVIGGEGFGVTARAAEADASETSGSRVRERSHKLRRAEEMKANGASIEIITEEEFCRRGGLQTPEALRRQYHAVRDILARYRSLREDHLRYLVKWGVIRPVLRTNADTFFAFPDLASIRQANEDLEHGTSFRAIVRALLTAQSGQLAFDFRLDASPARVITLTRPANAQAASAAAFRGTASQTALAEEYFRAASILDDGDDATRGEAAATYRKALDLDPYLVPALINLANIHYSRDELVEAQALYQRAIGLEPDFFEAHFNLGNIYHDLGRFPESQACYREALRLNPGYAEAHFYLAVTFEKMGLSQEARPHWRAYQQLAPAGEWVELAKEFSE